MQFAGCMCAKREHFEGVLEGGIKRKKPPGITGKLKR